MRICGLNIAGGVLSGAIIETVENFPESPQPGRAIFKDKRLWICGEVRSGVPMWFPCSQEIEMFDYVQSVNADTWVIEHPFDSNKFSIQVFDENSQWVIPDSITIDSTKATLRWLQPCTGFAVLISGSRIGAPKVASRYEQSFTASTTWVINHALGYDPIVQCIVGNAVAEPNTITHNGAHTSTTVVFNSAVAGTAVCV